MQEVDKTGKTAMTLHFIDCIVQGEQRLILMWFSLAWKQPSMP